MYLWIFISVWFSPVVNSHLRFSIAFWYVEKFPNSIIIIIITLCEFFTPALADGCSLESGDNKSPLVFRNLLSIMTDLL